MACVPTWCFTRRRGAGGLAGARGGHGGGYSYCGGIRPAASAAAQAVRAARTRPPAARSPSVAGARDNSAPTAPPEVEKGETEAPASATMGGAEEQVLDPSAPVGIRKLQVKSDTAPSLQGRRNPTPSAGQGHYAGAVRDAAPVSVAVDATLRAAAVRGVSEGGVVLGEPLRARSRKRERTTPPSGGAMRRRSFVLRARTCIARNASAAWNRYLFRGGCVGLDGGAAAHASRQGSRARSAAKPTSSAMKSA